MPTKDNRRRNRQQKQRLVYFVRHAQAMHNVQEQEAVAAARAKRANETDQEVARKSVLNNPALTDAPLSPEGLEQSHRMANQLRLLHQLDADRFPFPQVVLVSPLRRALQTATALYYASSSNSNSSSASQRRGRPKIVALEALREKRTGYMADERSCVQQLQREFPHINFDDLLLCNHPTLTTTRVPPVGEDNEALRMRTRNFVASSYMANLPEDCIAIVTHKAWLRELHHSVPGSDTTTTTCSFSPSATFTNAEVRAMHCTWEIHNNNNNKNHRNNAATLFNRLVSMKPITMEHALQRGTGHWREKEPKVAIRQPLSDDSSASSDNGKSSSLPNDEGKSRCGTIRVM